MTPLRPGRAPLVGRDAELAELRGALDEVRQGAFQAVVVSGEAGIGKSRLVRETIDEVASDVLVVSGECADSGSGPVPFAAATGIFRGLRKAIAADEALAADPAVQRLLGVIDGGAGSAGDRLLPTIGNGFEVVAARRPLVIVIEDLHWADGGTLDVVRYVLSSLRDVPMLVVLTVRSDDVGPHHPLRPVLAEFDRGRLATRVELERLGRSDALALAASVLGRGLDPRETSEVLDRGDGVPFFVEEVVDCLDGEIPSTLRDLLLVRYSAQPEDVRAVLRAIAAAGTAADHEVLAVVVGLTEPTLEAAIRSVIDAQVIVADGGGYRFRHALMGEAIATEILPGEGRRLHAAYARALEAAPRSVRTLTEAANHWWMARVSDQAFAAAVRALPVAAAARAASSAAELGERALGLWDAVSEPEVVAGMSRAELQLQTATALHRSGALVRAAALGEQARDGWPAGDPIGSASATAFLAEVLSDVGDERAVDYAEAGLAALPQGLGDDIRARLLLVKARAHGTGSDPEGGAVVASAAFETAMAAGDTARASIAVNERGSCRVLAGDLGGFDDFPIAKELAGDDPEAITLYYMNYSDAHMRLGDFRTGLEIAEEGIGISRRAGAGMVWYTRLAGNAIDCLIHLGEWDRAQTRLDEVLRLVEGSTSAADLAEYQLFLLVWQGRLDAAEAHLRSSRSLFDRTGAFETQIRLPVAEDEVRLLIGRGRAREALALADSATASDATDDVNYVLPLLATAARAISDARAIVAVDDAPFRERLGRCEGWATYPYWSEVFRAELGEGDWLAVIEADGPARVRPYARVRYARELVEAGERGQAAEQLALAIEEATALGAGLVLAEAEALMAAAGLTPRSRSADSAALSPRELQVLELIGEGLTNAQIAQRLFISGKTVSIHVSAILRKLGVASRTEAAVRVLR